MKHKDGFFDGWLDDAVQEFLSREDSEDREEVT